MFQLSFAFEFNDEFYDEWTKTTIGCVSDWYDYENEIQNKDILSQYVKNKYVNYFRKVILGPVLSVIGPTRTRLVGINTTMDDQSINTSLMM